MDEQKVRDAIVFNVIHGSRAYGTNIPGSDYDEKGIAILNDPRYYYGFGKFEQKDGGWIDGNDRVIYDIRKFFRLALKCNPNIIEVLFVEPKQIITITPAGQEIYSSRHMFLSRKASNTFSGYALSQMRRLENKQKFVNTPNWKHAMHLLRLLRMGVEILETGQVNVKRPDADYLIKIRRGEVSLDDINSEARQLLDKIDIAKENSPLPEQPDREGAEKLMISLIQRTISGAKEIR